MAADPVGVMRAPVTNHDYHNPPPYYNDYNRQPMNANQSSNQINIINNAAAQPVIVTEYVQARIVPSYYSHKVLACFAFWCFFGLFGLIAFILAVVADSEAHDGNSAAARHLGFASIALSICAIISGIIIYSLIFTIPYSY